MDNDTTFANTKATNNGTTHVVVRFDVEIPIQFHSVDECIDHTKSAIQDNDELFLLVAVFVIILGKAGKLRCCPDLVCCVGSCTGVHHVVGIECCMFDSGEKWQRPQQRQQRLRERHLMQEQVEQEVRPFCLTLRRLVYDPSQQNQVQ